MKVALLSTQDYIGGASRAAYRLHQGLQRQGVDSWMLVQNRFTDDPQVIAPQGRLGKAYASARSALDSLPTRLYAHRMRTTFTTAFLPDLLAGKLSRLAPDLIHLHWVGTGFVRIEGLRKRARPLVWTLHDAWPFTGGCHFVQSCVRFREGCGACPQLGSTKSVDLSRWVWRRKARAWRDVPIALVAPSRWMRDCARASALFRDRPVIEVIPNGLDTVRFRPLPPLAAREALGLPVDKQLVLFGAVGATSDARKGFDLLVSALHELARDGWAKRIHLVVFGARAPAVPIDVALPVTFLGRLYDDASLILAYSAADVAVVPSREESFGQTASEAHACGLPVVAFDTSGLRDIVQHGVTGYLARGFEPMDLARGLAWVLEDSVRRAKLGEAARSRAVEEFSIERVAQRYLDLYRRVLA